MRYCPQCGVDRSSLHPNASCLACGAAGAAPAQVPVEVQAEPPLQRQVHPAPPPFHYPATPSPPHMPLAPIQPRPFKIAFGVAFCVLSCWLLFSWIPSKRPMTEVEATAYVAQQLARGNVGALNEWRLNPTVYPWAYVVAALIGVWGVSGVVRGATYRPKSRK